MQYIYILNNVKGALILFKKDAQKKFRIFGHFQNKRIIIIIIII